MHILPSLKTFRLFLIALLAVALTGGIAFFNSSPATAATPLPSVSMEVVAAQSGLGTVALGSPVYLTGQGLRKGSPFSFDLVSDSSRCEHVTGSSSLKISDGAANVSLRLPDFSSPYGCKITATLTAEFDPALWPGCDDTQVITATVRTVMYSGTDGKVFTLAEDGTTLGDSTTSGVGCEPVNFSSPAKYSNVDMVAIRALQRAISTFGDLYTPSVTTGSFDCPTDSAGLALPCNKVNNNHDRECGTDSGGFPVMKHKCGGFNNNTTWLPPAVASKQAEEAKVNTIQSDIPPKAMRIGPMELGIVFSIGTRHLSVITTVQPPSAPSGGG